MSEACVYSSLKHIEFMASDWVTLFNELTELTALTPH